MMTCSICQHRTRRDHHKHIMGGVPGAVCWYCFLAWYECGLTSDEAIRRESIQSREREETLKEHEACEEILQRLG